MIDLHIEHLITPTIKLNYYSCKIMHYMSESVKHFTYLTESNDDVQHYLHFIDKETEVSFN